MSIPKILSILESTHQLTMLEQLQPYTPFQQLIATMLSARTKDTTTIPIVHRLFKSYKTPSDFLKIKAQELYGIGFYRVKTKNIHKLSKLIIEKYHGQVPADFEQLITLPGVGRKTANCLLSYTFHQPAIAVDVHVHRISNRLGWVKTKTPEETEARLKLLIPKKLWSKINMLLVNHGQTVCKPVKPDCGKCNIISSCAYYSVLNKPI